MEETANTRYIVLPINPRAATAGELTDEELEAVAGGVIPVLVAVVGVALTVTAAVEAAVEIHAAVHAHVAVKAEDSGPW